MAIEKPMVPADLEIESNPSEEELTVEIVNPDSVSMETEDGGVVLDFTGELTEDLIGPDHDANLAEFIDESELQAMASELISDFNADRESRSDWARAYVKGQLRHGEGVATSGSTLEHRQRKILGVSRVSHFFFFKIICFRIDSLVRKSIMHCVLCLKILFSLH